MKRMVNALGKLNWGKRAYAIFVICAMTAISLPAQTLTSLHNFNGTDGKYVIAGLVQACLLYTSRSIWSSRATLRAVLVFAVLEVLLFF